MKELIHNYKGSEVRTKRKGEEILFCATDVGSILEIISVQRQVRQYKKGVHTIPTLTKGGMQNLLYINEGNLYRLIFKSKKKEAIEFQDWVLDEVLPTIRKTGQYSIPKTLIDKSKKDRNYLTSAWKDCGIEKKHHFIQLTLQEYKALGLEKGKRKKDFSKEEIALLSALEAMETLNLMVNPADDYYSCKDSLYKTSDKIKSISEPKKAKELN